MSLLFALAPLGAILPYKDAYDGASVGLKAVLKKRIKIAQIAQIARIAQQKNLVTSLLDLFDLLV